MDFSIRLRCLGLKLHGLLDPIKVEVDEADSAFDSPSVGVVLETKVPFSSVRPNYGLGGDDSTGNHADIDDVVVVVSPGAQWHVETLLQGGGSGGGGGRGGAGAGRRAEKEGN